LSNVALALKYRPKRFEDLIGQDIISLTLSRALDTKRLGHAYLFSGLRGSGKTSTARIFAKALLCQKGISSKPCDVCDSCKSADEYRHIDIIELDGASNRKIDDIRDLIEQTKYKPAVSRFKIFIIDEVHMLTKEAFNALLKTLEEPPEYVKFILATTDPLKLPATILSRTQHFSFKKIPNTTIVNHLIHILDKENIPYEQKALEILSRSGSGSLRDTLTLLDQAIIYSKGSVDTNSVVGMLGILDPKKIEEIFDTIFENNKDRLFSLVKELEGYDSEVLLDEIVDYLKDKFFTKDVRFNAFVVERFFRIVSSTKTLLAINADNGFAITLMLFKMIEALNEEDIDYQIKTLTNQLTNISCSQNIPVSVSQQKNSVVKKETKKDSFQELIKLIYDRNYELGECFEKNITFVNYSNGILEWISCAKDECKKNLVTYWGVIKHLVQTIYGVNTKIKAVPCNKKEDLLPSDDNSTKESKKDENFNSSSMIEDVEIGSSCIQDCSENEKIYDSKEILNLPIVKKAIEIFDSPKVEIKSKI